jgi:hypothetical protein
MAKEKIPPLPALLSRKIYKTGQTRGADDDVIFQNRVNRNSTVLIPIAFFDICKKAPDNDGIYENGFIVLVKPEEYFEKDDIHVIFENFGLELGNNALLFYETRDQWIKYNPSYNKLEPANSRVNPLNGHYVARVPNTTAEGDEKIVRGFNTSGMKGAGIRVYEYASKTQIVNCQHQLEYLYWNCFDAEQVSANVGMSGEDIAKRKEFILKLTNESKLNDKHRLFESRIIDEQGYTICPLCLEKLSATGFYNRLEQQEGRDVPDLTVTQLNLFHIRELRTGEFNHKPYNLGWGHHHCNVVCKDSGIIDTLKWMSMILETNRKLGYI